jgi:hypothetical protein
MSEGVQENTNTNTMTGTNDKGSVLLNNSTITVEMVFDNPLTTFKWNISSDEVKYLGLHTLTQNEYEHFSIPNSEVNSAENVFLLSDKTTIYNLLQSLYVDVGRQCHLMKEQQVIQPPFNKNDLLYIRKRFVWFPNELPKKAKSDTDMTNEWMYDLSILILQFLHEYKYGTVSSFNANDEKKVKDTLDIIKGSPLFFSISRSIKDKSERMFIHM